MSATQGYKLSGTALPKDTIGMLDEIAEHFIEHSDVLRTGNNVLLKSDIGTADIRAEGDRLLIDLISPSEESLQLVRTMLAEHLFYFAGDDPFELSWSELPPPTSPSNLYEVTVVSAEDVTPHMRRVKFACADVSPFVRDDMHVRLLIPPKGRPPVWPGIHEDGRLAWPKGDDKIVVRIYTIRAVDVERGELWIDFLQHPAPGVATPGADFARDAEPGQTVALIGPGGSDKPKAARILLVGDESALPAIARIVAEAEPGTDLQAIIEVENEAEQQLLATRAKLDVRWLHRASYPPGATAMLADAAIEAIAPLDGDTFIWVAGEKKDVRAIKSVLKTRQHDRKLKSVAWYWERGVAAPG
ncbi:siderophore-interacting protein [Rhizobium sp. CG5]|uniref:DUF2218 domain-containing protein n=1 Tax=Rhizobium sp. CG5 TaxID=2726076 RepID=UPI0020335E09|nr:DUF2218 domain-containing protein [Rhizobium sp. CG5]MCM2477813.1 siderophore-interacting protein [Rhizobium sp. CG5]